MPYRDTLLTPFSKTSALDAHSESELMKNINALLQEKSRTSIFIAHRLRTVVEAGECCLKIYSDAHTYTHILDLILVLRDGVVVEQGTHDELIRKGGLYQSMWLEQAYQEETANVEEEA